MSKNIKIQTRAMVLDAPAYLNRISVLLALVCALSVLVYGVLLLEAVAHAASQTTAQREIGQLTAALGDLEAQYLAQSQSLTPQRAAAMGYVAPDPSEITTVFAAAPTQSLSLRGQ